MDRHNSALKCFFGPLLVKLGFCSKSNFWFSTESIKPSYENERYRVYWDIPEYNGSDNEDEATAPRPDGKVVLLNEKKIFLIEMTVPWIEYRETKYDLKASKYKPIQGNLKLEYPDFQIDQITLVMDVLGGYSNHLRDNIEKVFEDKKEVRNIIRDMQKAVICNAAHLVRVFKLRT